MNKLISLSLVLVFSMLSFFGCSTKVLNEEKSKKPYVQREFRAAWIATVDNINWPSEPGLPVETQKKEAIVLLDLLEKNNYNAVIFQARPQADALYKSELEPWSYYLTGKQGEEPVPFYDPLEFWIKEAHSRGIELHVWLNPYRAHHIKGKEITKHSIVKKHPEISLELSSGYWWFDPSHPKTQDHSYNVVMDILDRYDVDGVHFDDYFYPYPSYHTGDFPDSLTWKKYKNEGGKLSRGDWRRDNVNKFVKRIYEGIKKEKPYVKFGLSPFGIWRPNNPQSIKGFDQYDKLYADAKLWLNEGWIDYWTPQLYWTINDVDQSFPVLLGWWKSENSKKRHLWPGLNIASGSDETINQIMITRGMFPENPGNIHWSIAPLVNDSTMGPELLKTAYKDQALVPSFPWLDNSAPAAPQVKTQIDKDTLNIKISHSNSQDVFKWVVQHKYGSNGSYTILPSGKNTYKLPVYRINQWLLNKARKSENLPRKGIISLLNEIKVSAVDRNGNESTYVDVDIPEFDKNLIPDVENLIKINLTGKK